MSYTLRINSNEKKVRGGFSLVNDETGENIRGVQECTIHLSVERSTPLVTLKFYPDLTDVRLENLKELSLVGEELPVEG